jgi:tRNA(Ile)-lysidine synthase
LYAEPAGGVSLAEGTWRIAEASEWPLGTGCALELVAANGRGLSRDRLPAEVQVVARMDGAEFRAAGAAAHRRPLRKWFQEHGVLPWRRDTLPLLCVGGRIIAIADISCAAEFAARPDEPSWCVRWRGRPALTEQEVLAFNWPEHPPIH